MFDNDCSVRFEESMQVIVELSEEDRAGSKLADYLSSSQQKDGYQPSDQESLVTPDLWKQNDS